MDKQQLMHACSIGALLELAQNTTHVLVRATGKSATKTAEGFAVGGVVAVGEVQTRDVHAGVDQLSELLLGPARWSNRAHDLGLARDTFGAAHDAVESVGRRNHIHILDAIIRFEWGREGGNTYSTPC